MNKHFFKTNELPLLAAIVLLIKLAALIDGPVGRSVTVYTLDAPDYFRAGFDNTSIFILDYDNLITQTSRSEETPAFILITVDSQGFQYYSSSAFDCRPETEQAGEIDPPERSLMNVDMAGLYLDSGLDCK